MEKDKCWACGSEGDHPDLGGHYWPCGTMKCASIRGENCYELEISRLHALIHSCNPLWDDDKIDEIVANWEDQTKKAAP